VLALLPERAALPPIVVILLALAGCSLDRSPIRGGPIDRPDASRDPEAGVPDGGRLDGAIDAGPLDDGGPPDAGTDTGPPCTAGFAECEGGEETFCDPSSGVLVTRSCALGCRADAIACAQLSPSNVPASLFDAPGAAWRIDAPIRYDTDTCDDGVHQTQSSGPEVCVRVVASLEVTSSGVLEVIGSRPMAVLAIDGVTIAGTIDVSAEGSLPGPGGGLGGERGRPEGIGPGPGREGGTSGSYEDGGGGGGAFCGDGGDGGRGDSANGGEGGTNVPGAYLLEPLQGGSGGGWSRGAAGVGFDSSARGGAGGGAIQISSRTAITITATGAILAGGGGGAGGGATESFTTNYGGGGGGGSGGGVLLEAPALTFEPGARVWTTGGGGGGSGDGEVGVARPGLPGQDGRETGERATGGAAGGPAYGADGGRSGGGTVPTGDPGNDNIGMDNTNGGGGGGGVGCIVLRSADGAHPTVRDPFSARVDVGLRAAPADRE
jgi:hypothetical protein